MGRNMERQEFAEVVEVCTERTKPMLLTVIVFAGIAWAFHVFATMVVIFVLCRIAPQFEQVFCDFDCALPPMTHFTLHLSFYAVRYWYLLALAVLFVDGPLAVAVQYLPPHLHWLKTCWFALPLLATLFFLFFAIVSLWMPTISLLQNLSGT